MLVLEVGLTLGEKSALSTQDVIIMWTFIALCVVLVLTPFWTAQNNRLVLIVDPSMEYMDPSIENCPCSMTCLVYYGPLNEDSLNCYVYASGHFCVVPVCKILITCELRATSIIRTFVDVQNMSEFYYRNALKVQQLQWNHWMYMTWRLGWFLEVSSLWRCPHISKCLE